MATKPDFPPTAPAPLTNDRYVQGDPIPVPEVVEKNSETVWALWTDMVNAQDSKETTFADTVPASFDLLEQESRNSKPRS